MTIKISDKFAPLFDPPKGVDIFIITGGRYSQKSFAVSLSAINSALVFNHRILYSRYTNASLKDSIFAEVEEKIDILNVNNYFQKSINRIEVKGSKAKIVFKGLKAGSNQQTANLKGLKDFSEWILDEAEELTDETICDKILLSIRGNPPHSEHKNIKVWILNPTMKDHFIYKKYFLGRGVQEGSNIIKKNVCYIHTTYLDCLEFVPQEIVDFFEDMKLNNPLKYNHVVLGGWLDKMEGVVYPNWSYGPFNPDNLQTSCGMDFGFVTDPDALVEVAIDKTKKKIYVKEHIYQNGLKTQELSTMILNRVGNKLIVADSAEPRLIEDLKSTGVNIMPVKKGTIESGVIRVQDFDLIVEQNSQNIAKELNNYVYMDKKSQLYIDDWNHALDALRYNVIYHLDNPNAGNYYVY